MLFCLHACLCISCMPGTCKDSIRCPRTRVTDGFMPPYGCWETNLGPLEEQQLLSNTAVPVSSAPYPGFLLVRIGQHAMLGISPDIQHRELASPHSASGILAVVGLASACTRKNLLARISTVPSHPYQKRNKASPLDPGRAVLGWLPGGSSTSVCLEFPWGYP